MPVSQSKGEITPEVIPPFWGSFGNVLPGSHRIGKTKIHHILIVWHDRKLVRLVQSHLEQAEYKISVADDGEDALKQAAEQCPDLIILDIMLPKLDGFKVLEILRQQPDTQDILVLMLLPRPNDFEWHEDNAFKTWEAIPDGYLLKPFKLPEHLITMIERMSL